MFSAGPLKMPPFQQRWLEPLPLPAVEERLLEATCVAAATARKPLSPEAT
jgi:hypothetical protein